MESRKREILGRLDKGNHPDDLSQPVIGGSTPHYELAGRATATAYGGIGLVHQFVQELGLAEAINSRLKLFKVHLPYHESDHVLSLAYNALCQGQCLEDLETRRQDAAYLDMLGAQRIPDPTTAGDFCRRFQPQHLDSLQAAYDVCRRRVWALQPDAFFAEAIIEADGTMVETGAECKQGIDISYKGVWGYHPLVMTLANTGEVLRLVNRSGNRPSHEGAAEQFDQCIDSLDNRQASLSPARPRPVSSPLGCVRRGPSFYRRARVRRARSRLARRRFRGSSASSTIPWSGAGSRTAFHHGARSAAVGTPKAAQGADSRHR